MDYLNIGPAPCDEDCVQVNKDGDYVAAQRAECKRFITLIRKKLGEEPPGARLKVKGFPHDFGTYYEVVCEFDENDEEACKYALLCERSAPANWDLDLPMVYALVPQPIEIVEHENGVTAIVGGLLGKEIEALGKCRFFVGIYPCDKGLRVEFVKK